MFATSAEEKGFMIKADIVGKVSEATRLPQKDAFDLWSRYLKF
jgi:hypothetical protein